MQQLLFIVFSFKGKEQALRVGGVYDQEDLANAAAQAEANLYGQPASVSECPLNSRLEDSDSWSAGKVKWFWPETAAAS